MLALASAAVSIVFLLGLARADVASRPSRDCIQLGSGLNGTFSLFPSHARSVVSYASDFTIEYHNTYKVVRNTWRNETYILHQCGADSQDHIQAAKESFPGAKHFTIPLNAVSAPDTSVLDFMDLLGVHDRVRWTSPLASEPCMQLLSEPGCSRTASDPSRPGAEAELEPADAFFIWSGHEGSNRTVAFTSTRDHGALARGEWIKFVAAFFNAEERANALYEQLVQKYEHYKRQASLAAEEHTGDLPLLAWLSYSNWTGTPTARITNSAFKADLTKDAGARILAVSDMLESGATSAGDDVNPGAAFNLTDPDQRAALVNALKKVDILVEETRFSSFPGVDSVDGVTKESFVELYGLDDPDSFPFLKDNRLYRIDGVVSASDGLDWWERGVSRPDILLADLVRAVHQAAGHHRAEFIYNIHLDEDHPRVVKSDSCSKERMVGGACNLGEAAPICPFSYKHGSHLFHTRPFEDRCSPSPFSEIRLGTTHREEDCLSEEVASRLNGTVSVFPEHAHVHVTKASNFEVEYHNTYKVVRNTQHGEKYVLHQCGASTEGLAERYPDAKLFQIPLTAVATPSTTVLGFMELLGVNDRIRFTSNWATDACLQHLASPEGCDKLAVNPTDDSTDLLQLAEQQRQADAFFVGSASSHPKTIAFTSTSDGGPLERAEWLKFVAMFFNKEDLANTLYEQLVANYAQYEQSAARAVEDKDAAKPVMAWIRYLDFFGPKEAIMSFSGYRKVYSEAAGARLLDIEALAEQHGNAVEMRNMELRFDLENEDSPAALRSVLAQVDILIDTTHYANYGVDSVADIGLAHFKDLFRLGSSSEGLPFAQNDQLYRVDGRVNANMGLDWFEQGVARPDIILADLVRATHLEAAGHHTAQMVRNVKHDTPEVVDKGSCSSEGVTEGCNAGLATAICPYIHRHESHLFHARPFEDRCSPAPPSSKIRLGTTHRDEDCLSEEVASRLNGTVSVFPEHVRVEVTKASDFKVEYHNTYKVVTNTQREEQYVLHQCGAPLQDLSQQYPRAKLFEIPLTAVSTPDTTVLGFLELLGVSDRVRFTSSRATSACMQHLASPAGCSKRAVDPTDNALDLLQLAQQQQQVDAFFVWSASDNKKTVAFTSTSDGGPLERAEWLKFVALFFNKEDLANTLYEQLVANYAQYEQSAARAVEDNGGSKPAMAWISYSAWGGPKRATVSFSEYRRVYAESAGVRLLDIDALAQEHGDAVDRNGPNLVFSLEQESTRSALRSVLSKVDILIDTTGHGSYGVDSVADIGLAQFKDLFRLGSSSEGLPFAQNDQLYRVDGRVNANMGLDWFEQGVARPDIILADLVRGVHSIEVGNHDSAIVRNVQHDTPEVVDKGSCSNEGVTEGCNAGLATAICPFIHSGCGDYLVHVSPLGSRCPASCSALRDPEGGVASTSSLSVTFTMDPEAVSSIESSADARGAFERATVRALQREIQRERAAGSGLPDVALVGLAVGGRQIMSAAGGRGRRLRQAGADLEATYRLTVQGARTASQADEDARRLADVLNGAAGSEEALRELFDEGSLDSFVARFGVRGLSSAPGAAEPSASEGSASDSAGSLDTEGSGRGSAKSRGLSGGDIAGIVVGVVVGSLVMAGTIAIVVVVVVRDRRRRQEAAAAMAFVPVVAPAAEGKGGGLEGKKGAEVAIDVDSNLSDDHLSTSRSNSSEGGSAKGSLRKPMHPNPV